jgi:hypothetical protein
MGEILRLRSSGPPLRKTHCGTGRSQPKTDALLLNASFLLTGALESNIYSFASEPVAQLIFGPLAQSVEQQTFNLRVEGSIPSRLTVSVP